MDILHTDILLEYIESRLIPDIKNKKERGEVFTPMGLVNEILDKLPKSVWRNTELKWLDPAAGIGNFPVAIYMRLMEGLSDALPDEEERRRHILENMLYMVEINKKNVYLMKKILCGMNYKLNVFEGSFIDYKDMKKQIFSTKFDIIIANPPFQYNEDDKQARPIWHLFVEESIKNISNNGYLAYIHPSGWRDAQGFYKNVFDYIKAHNMIYLSMNDYKTGSKVFGVGTNFDYYVVQNKKTEHNITTIKDIDDKISKINLNTYDFIPSGKFEEFEKIIAKKNDEKVDVLYSRSMYGSDKKWISDNKSIYPCCYSITQKDGMKLKYSIYDKGHFKTPKVIWSDGSGTYPTIDFDGSYGLTQFCYAIIDKKENLPKIKEAMEQPKFIDLMKYLKLKEDHKYNYKIIRLFKKDFYKYFLQRYAKSAGGKKRR